MSLKNPNILCRKNCIKTNCNGTNNKGVPHSLYKYKMGYRTTKNYENVNKGSPPKMNKIHMG